MAKKDIKHIEQLPGQSSMRISTREDQLPWRFVISAAPTVPTEFEPPRVSSYSPYPLSTSPPPNSCYQGAPAEQDTTNAMGKDSAEQYESELAASQEHVEGLVTVVNGVAVNRCEREANFWSSNSPELWQHSRLSIR